MVSDQTDKASSSSNGSRRRRSPRLAKAVEVRVAGRGESGEVIVESTQTVDISKHGAAIVAHNHFPVGSPIAIRRPGAKPMRARVVSAKPTGDNGFQQLGVEFVGEDSAWDLEFPKDWEDYFRREPSPVAHDPEQRRKMLAEDGALEAVLRKAEELRTQSERLLTEYTTKMESTRRQNTSALAAQVEEFRAWRTILEGESETQVTAAREAIRAELERGKLRLEQEVTEVARRVRELSGQCTAELKASEELYQQMRVAEAQKNTKQVARIAAQLEAQRRTITTLEEQAAQWRQQTAANIEALQNDVQAVVQKAAAEMESAAAVTVKDFRQKLPALSKEMEKYFSTFLSEQKLAAAGWLEQSAKNLRAGTAALEQEHRAALCETAKQAAEEFTQSLNAKLEEFRKSGAALASPLDARIERFRTDLGELSQGIEQALTGARQNLSTSVERSLEQLEEAATAKSAQIGAAELASRRRLEQAGEVLHQAAHEAERRVDQTSLDLQALGANLQQQSIRNRDEMEAHFASLLAVYDNRKEVLDRLLQTVEGHRAALSDSLEILRVNTEENQARLQRFTGAQETVLRTRTAEMEQRLAATLLRLEVEMRERTALALQASHDAHIERLKRVADEDARKFAEGLDAAMAGASDRVPELLRELDHCFNQHVDSLASEQAIHQTAMSRTRDQFTQQGREAAEQLGERTREHETALRQVTTEALAAVDDKQAAAAAAVGEMLKGVETQRVALTRIHSEQDRQVQQWRQAFETHFSALSAKLDEKRQALESFYSSTEQARAAWVKNMGVLDRRMEDVRSAVENMERQVSSSLDKHAANLGVQLDSRLRQLLAGAETELNALAEAGESAFRARVADFAQQSLKAAERQVELSANQSAIALDRTMQRERREHERQVVEMGKHLDGTMRDQEHAFRESTVKTMAEMEQHAQQVCRTLVEQMRESRDALSRDLPGRLSEAEESFHRNLERIQERALAAATEELRLLASRWLAREDMEMSQRRMEMAAADGD